MTDLDALLTPSPWDPNRCQVDQALERITDTEVRGKVAAAARNRLVPPRNVESAVKQLIGVSPKPLTIRRHRNGDCACV